MRDPLRFATFELRTTDVDGARTFYSDVLGAGLPPISPLHERARALGAPAHWLGHVAVPDLEKVIAQFVQHGGQQLGPLTTTADGAPLAVMRDPFGSVIGIRAFTEERSSMAWHQLHTVDQEKALDFYNAVFGWRGVDALANGEDRFLVFAWDSVHPPVGTIANTARIAGVHPHWLFYFDVDDLDAAIARATERGAEVIRGPFRGPRGSRIAVLHDPQRAELGLREKSS